MNLNNNTIKLVDFLTVQSLNKATSSKKLQVVFRKKVTS